MSMKIQRGISMIEVVVTIAIMGILMAAAMPSLGDWLRNSKVRNTAESIQNGLQLARMEAVRRNRPVSFSLVSSLANTCALSATSGSWVVSGDGNPAGQCGAANSTTVAPQMAAKGSVSDGGGASVAGWNAANTAATTATFNGFGMLTGASSLRRIEITRSDGGFPRRVEITTGGVSRLCDPMLSITSGDTRACTQ